MNVVAVPAPWIVPFCAVPAQPRLWSTKGAAMGA